MNRLEGLRANFETSSAEPSGNPITLLLFSMKGIVSLCFATGLGSLFVVMVYTGSWVVSTILFIWAVLGLFLVAGLVLVAKKVKLKCITFLALTVQRECSV